MMLIAAWYGAAALREAVGRRSAALLEGYVPSVAAVRQEYARFYGKPLKNPAVENLVRQAEQRARQRDYPGAADLLETAARQAAVPAIFNNLGVLYARLRDPSRAASAFGDALARDIDYQPVRANLKRLPGFAANAVGPVTREVEPNDTNFLANPIAPGKAADAEIAAGRNDWDCFRLIAPAAPRDILGVEIENRSKTLVPVLVIYDSGDRRLDWGKEERQPGSSLVQYMSPAPNTTLFLNVHGYENTGGAYTLAVRPLKAFDQYEPNDDILSARRIAVGEPIHANIMDGEDTDYYSFVSPRAGRVTVKITNRSATLIPALSTFQPDMRPSGFGPDVSTPGGSLSQALEVRDGETYYLQIWSREDTAGEYELTVK